MKSRLISKTFYLAFFLMINCTEKNKSDCSFDSPESGANFSSTENSGYFTDTRDCQQYKWIRIGNQIWMAENLNYSSDTCYTYNDSLPYSEIYGKLYLWRTACEVCPTGWHLPSDNEWKELEVYLGMDSIQADSSGSRFSDVACKLKSSEINFWTTPNFCATNESGFTALPAGFRSFVDEINPYHALGKNAHFWTSTIGGETYGMDFSFLGYNIWARTLYNYTSTIYRGHVFEKQAYSVRCIKDY